MKRKLEIGNWIVILACILMVAIGGACSIWKMSENKQVSKARELRVLCSEMLYEIQNGQKVSEKYPFVTTDLCGKVLTSTKEGIDIGYRMNINEQLSFAGEEEEDRSEYQVCFALEKEDKNDGFVIIYVPAKELVKEAEESARSRAWIPFGLGVLGSMLFFVWYAWYVRHNVYQPVREISKSANAIIAGNYDVEVVRVYGETVRSNEVGELIYSFELMRDELKEKQMREEELTLANKELISCISHDLRTPLATIKAYAEGMRDGIARTEEQRKQYVGIILNKTNLLVGMIKELLEYSNAQASRMSIEKKEVYLQDFLGNVLTEVKGVVEKRKIHFITDITKENPLLYMDERRITEVLFNLIENSMKYMDKEKGEIQVIVEKKSRNICFKVIDNGMGISAEDILYVFDKFYRAEKSRSSSVPGSGLGLSICQYIIREHGGEITCRSHIGEGCEITFTIPLS